MEMTYIFVKHMDRPQVKRIIVNRPWNIHDFWVETYAPDRKGAHRVWMRLDDRNLGEFATRTAMFRVIVPTVSI